LYVLALVALACTSCDDSKYALCEPQQALPDPDLVGVWRLREPTGETVFYHIGRVEGKLPPSVRRLIGVNYSKEKKLEPPAEMLIFSYMIRGRSYICAANVEQEKIRLMEEKGWLPEHVEGYFIFAYRVEKDTLLVWPMNMAAKKQAVASGKIQGEVKKTDSGAETVKFTDTPAKLAELIAASGENLFERVPQHLQRVP
jgi:hypothetical protein